MAALSSLIMGAQAIAALSSVVSGFQSAGEADNQAALAMQQASMRGAEAERAAQREAKLVQEDALATERKQKLAYLASGVTLEGSPLLIMEQTRQKGIENVNEILESGKAEKNAAALEGRVVASQAKASGREALMGGLMGGLKAGMGGLQTYQATKAK